MADVPMAFCDASFAPGGKTGFGWRRSRSGIVITLNGAAVLWLSKCQTCVAMSTCEAEYIALSQCAQEAVWTRSILKFLGAPQDDPMVVHEDNEAAAAIASGDAENTIKRTKAVDIRYHYTRGKVELGEIRVIPCRTDHMLADVLTKCLGPDKQSGFWGILRGEIDALYMKDTGVVCFINTANFQSASPVPPAPRPPRCAVCDEPVDEDCLTCTPGCTGETQRQHLQQPPDIHQQMPDHLANAISTYVKEPEVIYDHVCDQHPYATSTILSASLGPNCPTYSRKSPDG